MTDHETTELAFDVDAALIVELGERLVARRSVALAELIKNAYDADATEASVSFDRVSGSDGEIVVTDNGSGMNLETMQGGWMRIATTDASVNMLSRKFGRLRTGAKGVGRFACGRLASRLSLESVSGRNGGSERVTAEFDWRDYRAGRDLAEIKTHVTREALAEALPTGTTLRLSNLKDVWAEKDIADLQAELGALVDPHEESGYVRRDPAYEPDPGFEPSIHAPEFPRYAGAIGERFREAAWATLKGKVTSQGEPQYELEIRETNARLDLHPRDLAFRDLAGARFTIRMMVYAGSRFRGSGYSLQEARRLGRERGGVRIYLDGFQVFSYGSPGDDWLDLDQDKARRVVVTPPLLAEEAEGLERPMLQLPGNMQLFGAVALSRERNPGLAVSISRERLVHNHSFSQLKQFVRGGIDWMTVCYAREATRSRSRRTAETRTTQAPTTALSRVRELVVREEGVSTGTRRVLEAALSQAEALLIEEQEARISELSMLRVLASAGTTILVFDHTLRAMSEHLLDMADRLGADAVHLPQDRQHGFRRTLDDLKSWAAMATDQGSLVGLLVGPEARTRRTSLAVHPLVEMLRRGFLGYTRRFGINLENAVPATVRTPPLHEAELYAILLNLLTNSFKAVRERSERRVRIEAEVTARWFTLQLHDTGIGVPPENRDDIFEPFVTTSQPDPVLGIGTGLGLKIVRDLARGWGGDASFSEPMSPWRTTIKLTIPTGDEDDDANSPD